MSDLIVHQDIESLVEGWFKAEREGNPFPVPFDLAWPMAGYSRKDGAKRYGLKGLIRDEHFSVKTWKTSQGGRPGELIELSMAGFEHLCLMADTDEGKAVRDLYRQAKAKWDIVQQIAPSVAAEAELIAMKIELAKIEAQKEASIALGKQADLQLIQFRHIVTTTMPEPVQQKILGYSEITTVEYRDRIIHNKDIINDGSTILKGDLCHRYGLLTKAGKPDYKRLNEILEELPSDAFQLTARIQDNRELLRAYLPTLDQLVRNSNRQRWIGE